ncbi:hypothetical protein ElyMa_001442200 [Elysia marginata]|uniref:EGF-like domain-containing protein n=1 Tax=Elysia marginata TaxID=1093978 RepID=A0AAV4IXM1_9GAST|nr:hypothetical protein ElyMa_001442200 [Elysia marginata]
MSLSVKFSSSSPSSSTKSLSSLTNVVALTFTMILGSVQSFHTGGPHYSCRNLIPGHSNGTQPGPPPYRLTVSSPVLAPGRSTTGECSCLSPIGSTTGECSCLCPIDSTTGECSCLCPIGSTRSECSCLCPNGSTTVILESTGDFPFKGFLCAVSNLEDIENNSVGTMSFSSASSSSSLPSSNITPITCSDVGQQVDKKSHGVATQDQQVIKRQTISAMERQYRESKGETMAQRGW